MKRRKVLEGGTITAEELSALIAANGLIGHSFTCPLCEEPWSVFNAATDREEAERSVGGDYRCAECAEAEELLGRALTEAAHREHPEILNVIVENGFVYMEKEEMVMRSMMPREVLETVKRLGYIEGTITLTPPPKGTPWS